MRLWTPLQKGRLTRLMADETGATAIEYGLIVALIAIALIVALSATGNELSTTFGTVGDTLDANNTVP